MRWVLSARDLFVPIAGGFGGRGGGCVFFSGLFGRNCCSHEYVVCRGFGLCGIGGVAEFGLWEYLDRE